MRSLKIKLSFASAEPDAKDGVEVKGISLGEILGRRPPGFPSFAEFLKDMASAREQKCDLCGEVHAGGVRVGNKTHAGPAEKSGEPSVLGDRLREIEGSIAALAFAVDTIAKAVTGDKVPGDGDKADPDKGNPVKAAKTKDKGPKRGGPRRFLRGANGRLIGSVKAVADPDTKTVAKVPTKARAKTAPKKASKAKEAAASPATA